MKFRSGREARQKTAFLDQFSVRSASIPGIGPAKTATLVSFGVETAADVSRAKVQRVPGFGDVLTGKLLNWRRQLESRFRYDQRQNAQDAASEAAIRARFDAEKAKLAAEIRSGADAIRNAKARFETLPARAQGDQSLMQALEARAQAEHDLKAVGCSVPASKVTLSVKQQSQPASRQSITQPPSQNPAARRPSARNRSTGTPAGNAPKCPRCGSSMRHTSGRYGQFWGCSRYPICRGWRKK